MFTLWILCLTTAVYAEETTTPSNNVTTLYPTNKTIIRNDSEGIPPKKPQTWKLEAVFAESNLTEVEAKTNREGKEENEDKDKKEELRDFKPSPHLGSFFDEDSAEVIKTPMAGPVFKKPASGFVSSTKDEYRPTFNKIPNGFYHTHKQFPYKFEDAIYANAKPNWQEEGIDSKPTVESPIKLPAGGLYKSPVAFKKPHSDEEFGVDINEEAKEHAIKKRGNPWQNLLRLVTAFIPVGLIISALTPSVITIQNVDDNRDPAVGVFRRSDARVPAPAPAPAPISERCRRRLLCELHSDRYYEPSSSAPRRPSKHCYKLHCEDTEALWRTLRWLFTYNQLQGDQRGRQFTYK